MEQMNNDPVTGVSEGGCATICGILSRRQVLVGGAAVILSSIVAAGCDASGSNAADSQATATTASTDNVLVKVGEMLEGTSFDFTLPNGRTPAILVHLPDGDFVAYTSLCTHQMCTVVYLPAKAAFRCPCHGSTFSVADGSLIHGPATSGLFKLAIEVDKAGGMVRYTDKNWNLLLFAAKMVINDLDIVDFRGYNIRMNPYRRGRVWR